MSDIICVNRNEPPPSPNHFYPEIAAATANSNMNKGSTEITKSLESLSATLEMVTDPVVKQAMVILFNMVEQLSSENAALREEVQRLRDENNRLKGEQGKPDIKPNKPNDGDISSEKDRKKRKKSKGKKGRGPKRDQIKINKTSVCEVDKSNLPDDVQFKGYESVVVQDLQITPENTEFRKEVYYSPSQGKTYIADMPEGYTGEYGPGIRSLVISMKYVCNMSEAKVLEFLQEHGVLISRATISRMLTKDLDTFHGEKEDLVRVGLEEGAYQQIDDTAARVNGRNWHTHILCNDLYAAFFTTERKDRLTVLDILRQFDAREFLVNQEAMDLLKALRAPQYARQAAKEFPQNTRISESEMDELLKTLLPDPKQELSRRRVKEAAAIAAYHQEAGRPVVQVLFADDAPQFKLLTESLGLCWVHDGRHYKKLCPVVPHHISMLESFRERYWDFYADLLAYQEHPSKKLADQLSQTFDVLFSTKTGYDALDNRISKTKAKKEMLLLVLRHPEIPLHNNACELEARVAARRRDISLHTRSMEGTRACDTMTTIVRTAKKLGQSAFEYIRDRVSRSFQIPSLADLIHQRAGSIQSAQVPFG